jgi:hypothetical protein
MGWSGLKISDTPQTGDFNGGNDDWRPPNDGVLAARTGDFGDLGFQLKTHRDLTNNLPGKEGCWKEYLIFETLIFLLISILLKGMVTTTAKPMK